LYRKLKELQADFYMQMLFVISERPTANAILKLFSFCIYRIESSMYRNVKYIESRNISNKREKDVARVDHQIIYYIICDRVE
jgi:hypothetical protein